MNFNLHGDMVPSSVSVVATDEMLEVARIPTCVMPHGSRLNAQGTKHYSACMMDDELVEIDTRTLAVSRISCSEGQGAWDDRPDDGIGERPRHADARHGRPRHGAAQARQRVVLADLGAALARRPAGVRGVQQGQRDRGDRRRARGRSPGVFRRATASTTSRSRTTAGCWSRRTSGASRSRCSTRRPGRS